jgi:ABC-type transporter Mla MlaB component
MSFGPQEGLFLRAMRPPPEPSTDVLVVDVGRLGAPDITTVGALARLQLAAKRLGRPLRLRHASAELLELIDLAGLGEVLPCEPATPRGAEGARTAGRAGPCRGRT